MSSTTCTDTASIYFLNSVVYSIGVQCGQALLPLSQSIARIPSTIARTDVSAIPRMYFAWWVQLDPIHVIVETTLIISILCILLYKSENELSQKNKEKLSEAEEMELVQEWKTKTRAPLVDPQLTLNANGTNPHSSANTTTGVLVHQMKGKHLIIEAAAPAANSSTANPFTSHKKKQQIQVLNFATFDFLGFSQKEALKQAAHQALDRYGCGSCGPRGFYGTVDVHLQLEQQYAQFLQTSDAILYSDGASMCSSTIAAFCKRGDILVVDEGVYEPLLTGIFLSRANVKYFKHNDMEDLHRVLQEIQSKDLRLGRRPNAQKRFIIVEGLYKNSGTIAPLDRIVQLKHQYHYRLILDESFSFGTLGPTGKGALELYGLEIMKDAEIVTLSLENAMGSIGGITLGSDEVVDHQRLSGSGYCFSASSPPFTATTAMASLRELQQEKQGLLSTLRENVQYAYTRFQQVCQVELNDLFLIMSTGQTMEENSSGSSYSSPILFLQVADLESTRDLDELRFLKEIGQALLWKGGMAVATTGLWHDDYHPSNSSDANNSSPPPTSLPLFHQAPPPPGIRMTISVLHTQKDIDDLADAFVQVVRQVSQEHGIAL